MANLTLESHNTIKSLAEEVEKLDISYDKLNLKSSLISDEDILIINSSNLLDKYYDIILKNTRTITLTDLEFIKYRFSPKRFCYETYGTVELWSILLKINNWISVSEFNAKTFKIMDDSIFDLINEILILESKKIEVNKESIE